jgi:hypothetical protein
MTNAAGNPFQQFRYMDHNSSGDGVMLQQADQLKTAMPQPRPRPQQQSMYPEILTTSTVFEEASSRNQRDLVDDVDGDSLRWARWLSTLRTDIPLPDGLEPRPLRPRATH